MCMVFSEVEAAAKTRPHPLPPPSRSIVGVAIVGVASGSRAMVAWFPNWFLTIQKTSSAELC